MRITSFLFWIFLFMALLISSLQFGLYYFFVKPIVIDQIYQRGESIGYGFTQALATPLKEGMTPQVEEITRITASLDGIAYVFVTDNQGQLLTSAVNQSTRFSGGFLELMRKEPLSITNLVSDVNNRKTYRNVKMDGLALYQVSLPILGGDFVGYIAMFNTDVEEALAKVLIPQLILTGVMFFAAIFFINIIRAAIVFPIRAIQQHIYALSIDNVYERIELPALRELQNIGLSLEELRIHMRELLSKNRRAGVLANRNNETHEDK